MLYREIPFLRFTIALGAGIIVSHMADDTGGSLLPLLLSFLLLPLIVLVHIFRIKSGIYGMALLIFLFSAGYSLMNLDRSAVSYLPAGETELVLVAADYPSERNSTFRIPTRILRAGASKRGRGNHLMLYIYKDGYDTIPGPGDIITLKALPVQIEDYDPSDNFDYAAYMLRHGYRYSAFTSRYVCTRGDKPGLVNRARLFRMRLVGIYSRAGIKGENLGLVSALTLGYRDLLSPEISESFSRAGIMHIIAVSGLHVGIVSYMVMFLLSFIGARRNMLKLALIISMIWIYAFITGLSPPVVRAAIMFSILHTGRYIMRPANNLNSVLATAFAMLVFDPGLLFDPGFQLSYSAVIYILLFYRELKAIIRPPGRLLGYIWDITAVSILAQLGTLPFVAFYFHRLPLLSLLSNLAAIPLAFLILSGGFTLLLLSAVPQLSSVIAWIVDLMAHLLIRSAEMVSAMPFSSVDIPAMGLFRLLAMLVVVSVTTTFLLKKEKPHPHLLLASIILSLM